MILHLVKLIAIPAVVTVVSLGIADRTGHTTAAVVALALCVLSAAAVVAWWGAAMWLPLTVVVAALFALITFGLVWLGWYVWLMGWGWGAALLILALIVVPLFLSGIDRTRAAVRGERV